MKRLKVVLMMFVLAAMAQTAQAQNVPGVDYPVDGNDPAFQIAGYQLTIADGFEEQIALYRQWAIDLVDLRIASRIATKQNNLKVGEFWGGSAITGVIDVPWSWGHWYIMKSYRLWYYKPLGGSGNPGDPGA